MIVADTSALLSLATSDILSTILTEFDTHTTETVIEELEETSSYDDIHATAAQTVLSDHDRILVTEIEATEFTSSRIDEGEASCIVLTRELEADFLVTDDLRALPELQTLVSAQVALSPIILKALVKRGVLTNQEAKTEVEQIAENRDWLGAPIYRRAIRLFS